MAVTPPVAMTVAGTDSGGGAGIAADLKTFEALGVWGTCSVVAVTAQNTLGVTGVETVSPDLVAAQIGSVADDIGIDAAKTGMLATAAHVGAVADAVGAHDLRHLVVDPVAVSTTGHRLIDDDAVAVVRDRLLPLATVVTPNTAEAGVLAEMDEPRDRDGSRRCAERILDHGARAVLVTGGHLTGDPADLLVSPAGELWLEGEWLEAGGAHGGGCALSAAIAALLARGQPLERACREAKEHVANAIRLGPVLGGGARPVDPGWRSRLRAPRRRPVAAFDGHRLGPGLKGVRPTDRHQGFMAGMWRDERVAGALGGVRDEAGARSMLAGMVGHWARHGWGPWIVEADGVPVGWGGLDHAVVEGRVVVEVGYAVHPDHQGRGVATAVARAAVDLGRTELGFEEVVAIALADNQASQRVMEKAGLTRSREIAHKGWPHLLYSTRSAEG